MKFLRDLLASISALPAASAFFVVFCGGPLVRDRLDPIITPGKVSGHLHTISGGSAFNASLSYGNTLQSSCTSCNVKEDLSNYWTPDVWVRHRNGSFHPVRNGGHIVYYLDRSEPGERFTPFPPGFQMVAGDPSLRSYDASSIAQRAVSWSCIVGAGETAPASTPGFPAHKCSAGLRADVHFPSCWDGKNIDSADHKSHVSYPAGHWEFGPCPSSHPVRLTHLFYELYLDTHEWDGSWDGDRHPFVLSNGDPTGFGFHGDFVNRWDIAVLDRAINECVYPITSVQDCTHLTYNPVEEQAVCKIPQRVEEQIEGWVPALPGCNPVQAGPGKAVPPPSCAETTVVGPGKRYAADVRAKGWSYVGCSVDPLDRRVLPAERIGSESMTVEKCIDHCAGKGYSFAGTEWGVECFCGNAYDQPKIIADPNCDMACGGNTGQYCGSAQRISIYRKGA